MKLIFNEHPLLKTKCDSSREAFNSPKPTQPASRSLGGAIKQDSLTYYPIPGKCWR